VGVLGEVEYVILRLVCDIGGGGRIVVIEIEYW